MKDYSIAERIFYSIRGNVKALFTERLIIPLTVSFAVALIFIIVSKIKNKKAVSKKAFSLFMLVFYLTLLFDITVFSRAGEHYDPLSNVFGDWSILDTNFIIYVNFSPIINIIITIPLCFLVFNFIKQFFQKNLAIKKIILSSTLLCFALSLTIELIQLVFCLGTFQVSDLVYNTLGGVMGAIIFATVRKLYNYIKKARTQ